MYVYIYIYIHIYIHMYVYICELLCFCGSSPVLLVRVTRLTPKITYNIGYYILQQRAKLLLVPGSHYFDLGRDKMLDLKKILLRK